jgi:alkanesulfonate monooxygenase SsuD/methylene tetrahydromethanopterin reductase-like flavin-dependent oxidoreductase (luciferase family)
VRISVNVTDFSWPAGLEALAEVAAAADEGGLDVLWLPDHLIQVAPGADPDGPMPEAYTALGWLAARTSRIQLGTMVAAASLRPAALLIKAVTTLDVLSGGRAWLGIGAGYHQAEADALGLPLPPIPERFGRLEETLRLAQRMWAGGSSPPPASRPHPPVLVGGAGETRTLRLVAQYADACNLFDIPDGGATVTRKLAVLDRHCAEAGRPPGEIERTISTRLGPGEDAGAFAERCRALGRLGLDHVVVISAEPWTPDAVATLAAARAELAAG